jgi:drug/metabolite transporter (DMT)-like permease
LPARPRAWRFLALTPIIAMAMSSLFEGKRWGLAGLAGAALALTGQWLLLRVQSPAASV